MKSGKHHIDAFTFAIFINTSMLKNAMINAEEVIWNRHNYRRYWTILKII